MIWLLPDDMECEVQGKPSEDDHKDVSTAQTLMPLLFNQQIFMLTMPIYTRVVTEAIILCTCGTKTRLNIQPETGQNLTT